MSTVEERPVTYTSPAVAVGQVVNYFRFNRGTPKPIPCVVELVEGENLTLNSLGDRGFFSSVRHVSDPKLENPNLRENGAWDYPDDFKKLQTERKLLDEKVRGLESRISKLEQNRK